MEPISVLVHGVLGKMGQAVIDIVCRDPELEAVGAVDLMADSEQLVLPDGSGSIPLSSELETLVELTTPRVMVDFTQHDATMPAARIAARRQVNLVIGTTGLSENELKEIDGL